MQAQFLWPLLKRKAFLLRLNKGSNFLQSAFWIWITKRFSLVRELGVLASRLIFQSRLPLLCLAWLFCGVVWIWIFHRFLFFRPSHCMRPNCRAFNELETRHEILKYKSSIITPGEGVLPYITHTGMCRPTGSWFWSSWFRTGYPFQRRFLERGIKNCGSRLYPLLKIVADYEEVFIWCISRTNKEIAF